MPSTSPLRTKLRRVLALSLATPLATGAPACRTSEPGAPSAIDAASGPDAARDADLSDASLDDASACAPVQVEAGFFGEDGSCGTFVHLPCGRSIPLPDAGCYPVTIDLCVAVCPEKFFTTCQFAAPTCEDGGVVPSGPVYLECSTCLGSIGRRPVGLVPRTREAWEGSGAGSAVARYFALASYLEGASVEAFVHLHARLMTFGAPARLRRGVLRAAGDERRHARTTARLARRFGGCVERTEAASTPFAALTFEELALENAVEGCVRETFGALVALHQHERATDPLVARAMGRIATDETEHAELAWAIHRWALPRLSRAARLRVRRAQATALAELSSKGARWPAEVARVAGLPERGVEVRLADGFARAFFGAPTVRSTRRIMTQ